MTDDQLLHDYVSTRSEAAFEVLVKHNVNTIYAAALRQVGNPETAEEITQSVFLLLWKKHASIPAGRPIIGWLYRVTYFASRHALRTEKRRQLLQAKVIAMKEEIAYGDPDSNAASAWRQMSPLLDEALNRLGKVDREAVLLR